MRKVMSLIKLIGVSVFTILLFAGCAPRFSATKVSNLKIKGKLLIMPPHDVVQGGQPHPIGVGSGKMLRDDIVRKLGFQSKYEVIVYKPDDKFNFVTNISFKDAVEKSREMGVDYCLLLTLGEFRNAAPMTFRSDFVTLADAVLIDVKKSDAVWELDAPFRLDKTNIGNHYGLIDQIATEIVKSINN